MKGARGQTDANREFVQFLNTICHEVEPRVTVLLDLGVVNVHHLFFSPPGPEFSIWRNKHQGK
jgi:hypothetical protein